MSIIRPNVRTPKKLGKTIGPVPETVEVKVEPELPKSDFTDKAQRNLNALLKRNVVKVSDITNQELIAILNRMFDR